MKRLLKDILHVLGYEVRRQTEYSRLHFDPKLQRVLEFDDVICRRMYEVGRELVFVQIGAFDGIVQDPLRKYIEPCGWRGVMVEPQPSAVRRLRELYQQNDRVSILEAALDANPGTCSLHIVDHPDAPGWAGALASVHREVVLKHTNLIPGLPGMLAECTVPCVPPEAVIAQLPPGRVDLLQIDTEGADADIIGFWPFEQMAPAIVHWEVRHLTLSQRASCLARLAAFGYRFADSGDQDMIAVK